MTLAAVWGVGGGARAELRPDEVALIVARGNRESAALARYYCLQRGVPVENVCEVEVPASEEITRDQWSRSIRPAVREWLDQHDPDQRLRCLVTTWGVPLKIKAGPPDAAAQAYLAHLQGERAARFDALRGVADQLDQLGVGQPIDVGESPGPPADLKGVEQRLEASLQAAQARLAGLPADAARADRARLQQLATQAAGGAIVIAAMAQQLQKAAESGGAPPAAELERLHLLRGRASAFQDLNAYLGQRAAGYDRDELALVVLQQSGGLLAQVRWLDEQIKAARKHETGASFDSELSLVMWPDDYQLLRWQPNYLRPAYDGSQLRRTFRTLMVSRLDAPTLAIAKRLIDAAIEVEQQGGLRGHAYLDARGLAEREGPPLEPGGYPDYDRALLIAAENLKPLADPEGRPRLKVVLNDQPALFQPGECPDAALYCGWYSLADYVDAFHWRPGAVAYHLASAEARTLREPAANTWCKRMLEEGVAATIGPVYEPYLAAFPRPDEFFELLTRGDLTLVEAYYRAKPFNSWAMVLIGDPLYRPFK